MEDSTYPERRRQEYRVVFSSWVLVVIIAHLLDISSLIGTMKRCSCLVTKKLSPTINLIQDSFGCNFETMGSHLSIGGRNVISYESRLMRAIDKSDNESATYLIHRKVVDLDRIEHGHTALNLAIHRRNKPVVTLLVNAGCRLDMCEDIHMMLPPLLQSVMLGRHEFVQLLVEHGCNINIQSPENGNSALHIAVTHSASNRNWKMEDIVRYLVSMGADVNLGNTSGNTILHLCARLNQLSVLDYLLTLKQCDLDKRNSNAKNTALHEAMEAQNEEAALRLLQAGCDLNKKNAAGSCPLILSVRKQCQGVFNALLNHKDIVINSTNYIGQSAIHEACLKGRLNMVDLLLHHDARINEKDNYGNTPLHISARQGHARVVERLLVAEAKNHLCNMEGKSPLYLAVATSKHEVVKLLLHHGANINQTDKVNKSPLHAAVYQGNTGMVRLLIKHGADINVVDKHGRTPLLMASKHGRYEEGRFLIKAGANPDIYSTDDRGPLHMAVLFPKLDFPMISLLLDAGCDPLNLANFIDWILQNGIVKLEDFTRSELHEWYRQTSRTPLTLKHQCRVAVQTILRKHNHDDNYRQCIVQIPLPKSVQNYLSVKML